MIVQDPKPVLIYIEKTEKQVYSQGYTYNESGQTYNEANVAYGGIYGNEGQNPT